MMPVPVVQSRFLPRAASIAAAVLLLCCSTATVQGQAAKFCEGEIGQTNWACETLSPVPAQVYDGVDEFLPLPGSPDPDSSITYKQLAGEPVTFDADSGERNTPSTGSGSAAVFVLITGPFFCMVAESDGEAAIFDAPEGGFVSSTTEYPTSTLLSESIESLLARDTKLKYIVYSHPHWDHIGAAGLVYDHFKDDQPTIVASKRTRWALKKKDKRDPNTAFGNNRGVPIPDKLYDADDSHLSVGSLRFDLEAIHGHQSGNLLVFLDKNVPENSAQGISTSILMVVDIVYPGWIPFYLAAGARDVTSFYDALEQINAIDFDVLIPGHVSRLGTKADVQLQIDFYADVLKGSEFGIAAVSYNDVFAGTGVLDPTNPNAGNTWLIVNEVYNRRVDACEAYVLDSASRGRDWLAELGGVEPMLRSQCYAVQLVVLFG